MWILSRACDSAGKKKTAKTVAVVKRFSFAKALLLAGGTKVFFRFIGMGLSSGGKANRIAALIPTKIFINKAGSKKMFVLDIQLPQKSFCFFPHRCGQAV
jgi:hypothetical protein